MSKLSLIDEFYATKQGTYKITLEECRLICTSLFTFVKNKIDVGELRDIRLKYFGIFQVSSGRVKYYKQSLDNSFNNGNINELKYREKIKTLNNYKKN